jgi:quinol-cytochrome oxidoreductase complex cytochrome b subunit
MFQGLKYLPAKIAGVPGETIGVFVLGGLALAVTIVPLLDRGASRGRPARGWNAAAILVLLAAAVLTLLSVLPPPRTAP